MIDCCTPPHPTWERSLLLFPCSFLLCFSGAPHPRCSTSPSFPSDVLPALGANRMTWAVRRAVVWAAGRGGRRSRKLGEDVDAKREESVKTFREKTRQKTFPDRSVSASNARCRCLTADRPLLSGLAASQAPVQSIVHSPAEHHSRTLRGSRNFSVASCCRRHGCPQPASCSSPLWSRSVSSHSASSHSSLPPSSSQYLLPSLAVRPVSPVSSTSSVSVSPLFSRPLSACRSPFPSSSLSPLSSSFSSPASHRSLASRSLRVPSPWKAFESCLPHQEDNAVSPDFSRRDEILYSPACPRCFSLRSHLRLEDDQSLLSSSAHCLPALLPASASPWRLSSTFQLASLSSPSSASSLCCALSPSRLCLSLIPLASAACSSPSRFLASRTSVAPARQPRVTSSHSVSRPSRVVSSVSPPAVADKAVSLAKLCAEKNLCSRREAENFCVLGLISVDGRPVDSGQRAVYVHPDSHVELLPRAQRIMDTRLTVLLNKPMHYLSCQVDRQMGGGRGKPLCRQLLTPERRWEETGQGERRREVKSNLSPAKCNKLVCAGRLDVDSTGLTVFTQDGRLASQLVGPGKRVSKEYHVEVDLPVSAGALTLLRHGLSLDGLELLPAKVRLLSPLRDAFFSPLPTSTVSISSFPSRSGSRPVSETPAHLCTDFRQGESISSPSLTVSVSSSVAAKEKPGDRRAEDEEADAEVKESEMWVGKTTRLSIELLEGRHRQIRRMCELVGLRVLKIHRIRIGKVSLGNLPQGRWRLLLPHESFV
ncbi:putative pseudouridylate synthase [Toxoplasma gondii ARI]|uniref:Putative pseudouridylate synthase n=1 Tax=Toxoplasma gondii ARI TaxID=1074872 RepID=A0A139XQ98_TOXGO|nr:putative pseudouridylate synthase [Toxoplasma gondii ARI]